MSFPVKNIRKACALRNTTLKQVEKDLGFGNGVIARWETAKGSPPYDRIVAIAEHLNVSVSDLTGENAEKPAPIGDELSQEEEQFILWLRNQATEKEKALVRMIVEGDG